MQVLSLNNNLLTGTVPSQTFASMGGMLSLDIGSNKLHGTVPIMDHLRMVTVLRLNDNSFSGKLQDVNFSSNSLRLLDVSNNILSGYLPSRPFSLSSLSVFAAANNCLQRYLSDDICAARGLSVLALDGLTSATKCRDVFFKGHISDSYEVQSHPNWGIPNCIYEMPNLAVLHLSGNTLTGTLPADVEISPKLSDLTLSNNLLRGTIPISFQSKKWHNLDLSYNKLSGSLWPHIKADYNASFALAVNRLSGYTPSPLHDAQHVAILQGNMFQCDFNTHLLPVNDATTSSYSCGSDSLQLAVYIWLGVIISSAIWLFIEWRAKSRRYSTMISFVKERLAIRTIDCSSLSSLLSRMRYQCVLLTMVVLILFLPTYGFLGSYYSTHDYRYGWQTSVAFLTGSAPAMVLLVCWSFLLLLVFLYIRVSVKYNDVVPQREERGTMLGMFSFLALIALNVLVVILVNGLYVFTTVALNTGQNFAAQVTVGIFKILWSVVFVKNMGKFERAIFPSISRESYFTSRTFAWILIFNNVVIPCIAEAAADTNCYYNVLVAPNPVSISYYFGRECGAPVFCVFSYYDVYIRTLYVPPFVYSYQCSSVLITNYTSIFLYMFLSICIWNPVQILILSSETRRDWLTSFTVVRLMCHELYLDTPYFCVQYYLAGLLCYVSILLTFGVAYPPLALLICIAVVIDTLSVQYLISTRLPGIEDSCSGYEYSLMLYFLPLVAVFYSLILLDTAGDEVGYARALWAPLAMLCILVLLCLEKCFMNVFGSSHRNVIDEKIALENAQNSFFPDDIRGRPHLLDNINLVYTNS